MTAQEKRDKVVSLVKGREGKNQYTQSAKRTQVASGFGDCSSTMQWAYRNLGMEIGDYTESQMLSKAGKDVTLTISNGVPDESKMKPGDLMYFRGNDGTRTKGVGHVEMYVGNGQISGHASGTGPTRKDLVSYCTRKQAQKSKAPALKNCGLICVRRFIQDDAGSVSTVPQAPAPSVTPTTVSTGLKKGATVTYTGTRHYTSSDSQSPKMCTPGTAVITAIASGKPHPYHLEGKDGCTVYGWVNSVDVVLQKTGTLICDSLYLREKPDKASQSMGIMKKGQKVQILSTSNGWHRVIWNGKTGYASAKSEYIRVD